jgi:choline-sulfatase
MRGDIGRAIAMATGGVLAFVPIEWVLTVWTYAGSTALASKLRLLALAATLGLMLWLVLVAGLIAVVAVARVLAHRPLFVAAPLAGELRPGVPRLWAAIATSLAVAVTVQKAGTWAMSQFKEPQLTAALIAAVAVGALLVAYPLRRGLVTAAELGAEALAPFGVANPLARWRAAGVALAGLVCVALGVTWFALPQSRSVLPVRLVVSGCVIALGMGFGAWANACVPRNRRRRRTQRHALAVAGGALVLVVATLVWWGADVETKYMAITASPALDKLIELVRVANDLDRDGYGSLLGEADCAPLDPAIHPGAVDKPGDGIDQNCDGRDTTLYDLVAPSGPVTPVPQAFRREWNFLLLTIDATRYDHTSFGGYVETAHRDTTPRLADLVARSINFVDAQSPSAGTMASIPAILTSKFFHSGIALDEDVPRGAPPKILPENTTLPEIMKRGGYKTGVIGSHDWWNDWGLDQGVDEYDNSIGRTPDPFRVAADQVSNHALAFISRHQNDKWFLWAHYIDPHGRYVAHPDVVDYGSSEPDLYDAEIRWTDQEIGRLLDALERLPDARDTIVIVTSDHGESMGEHGVPSGTHGVALYRELTHVPFIVFIPEAKPRQIHGAVSNLDIVPTIAALAGIDTHDLQFEGKSLVGELFYGREQHDRVVFAETNAPNKQRAAIGERWRLIYYLYNNVNELFDDVTDPLEKTNIAPQNPPALATMRDQLQRWLDRVLYARDPVFNQAYRQIQDALLREPPAPEVPVMDKTLGGTITVLGIGHDPAKPVRPGTTFDVYVYFHVDAPTRASFRFQIAAWPGPLVPDPPANATRSSSHATADGAYPSERWRAGEYIRERFTISLPAKFEGDGVALGLYAYANEQKLTIPLGILPIQR